MKMLLSIVFMLFSQAAPLSQRVENGVMVGTLRGPNGAPAANVRVAAMPVPDPAQPAAANGLASLAETDSNGHYRLENVPPGHYYIQAGLIDFPSYYPGVSVTSGAKNIQVKAGELVSNLDFTMTRAAGVKVSGHVPLSTGASPVRIRMSGGAAFNIQNANALNPEGYFEFLKVPPGNYTINVSPSNVLPSLPIVVNDKDIEIGLPSGPGVKVSGTVGLGPLSPRVAGLRVILTGSDAWSQADAVVDAGGSFIVPRVPPGTYSVRTQPGSASPSFNLTVKDQEVTGLVVPSLVEVNGRVTMGGGGGMPATSTALMIEAVKEKGALLATAVHQDGSFRLPVTEGEYRIQVGKLPAGVSVKSMTCGSVDLLKDVLKLDGKSAVSEIAITLSR